MKKRYFFIKNISNFMNKIKTKKIQFFANLIANTLLIIKAPKYDNSQLKS